MQYKARGGASEGDSKRNVYSIVLSGNFASVPKLPIAHASNVHSTGTVRGAIGDATGTQSYHYAINVTF